MSPANRKRVLGGPRNGMNDPSDLKNYYLPLATRLQRSCKAGNDHICYLVSMNLFSLSSTRLWRLNNPFEPLRRTSVTIIVFSGINIRSRRALSSFILGKFFLDYIIASSGQPTKSSIALMKEIHHKTRHYEEATLQWRR